jgi:V8-like Glu-specific endopeptidase
LLFFRYIAIFLLALLYKTVGSEEEIRVKTKPDFKQLMKSVLFLAICAALLLSLSLPAAAEDQPRHPEPALEKPAFNSNTPRLVLQIIDGKLHKWIEYKNDRSSSQLSVLLLEPEQKTLNALEISGLFEASGKWEEQQRLHLSGLAANQVSLNNLVDNRSALDQSLSISYPYYTIGMLTVEYKTQFIRGTGFLISPYTVLTNAHNLYTTTLGGWHKSARFSPGQYETIWPETRQPFSTQQPVKTEVNQTFLRYESHNDRENLIRHDYGALFFSQPFEGITTFMPLQFNEIPTAVSVVGYPGFVRGSPSQGQWLAQGTVLFQDENCLFYDALTSGGSSGSPVFTYSASSGTYRVVAIHSFAYENKLVSGGPHLNSLNLAQIEGWLRWTPDGSGSQTSASVSLTLDKNSLTLDVGAIEMLLVNITPAELSTTPLTWSSSDNTVATVNTSGLVTAIRSGQTVITVRTADGAAAATCAVTVRSATGENIPVNSGIKGDLNGDQLVNIQDVALAQRHVLGLQLLPASLFDLADVNLDGRVDVRDVNLIMRYALGLINNF